MIRLIKHVVASRPARTLTAAAALCACTLSAPAALACWECDGIACLVSAGGARACFYGVGGCVAWGGCGTGTRPPVESDALMALQLTWLEAPPDGAISSAGSAAAPRIARGVGRRAFGAAAARAFRASAGGEGPTPAVVAAIVGFGNTFDVALRDPSGAGVTLAWQAAGRGGRIRVRAAESGRPLAEEQLAESDALLVPVRCEGRDYVLLAQPRPLARLAVRLESEELVRTARDAVRPGKPRLAISVSEAQP